MKAILRYLKPYYRAMVIGFTIKFGGTVIELALPWILAYMIDNIAPTGDRGQIFLYGFFMAVCAGLALAGNVIANRRASAVARDATRTIRHDLFSKIEHLTQPQIDRMTVPSLISRLTTDSYNINTTIARMQRLGVRAPILLLGGVTVTMIQDIRLSLVLLSTLPLLTVGIVLISRAGIPLYVRVQAAVDRLVRTVRDDVTGIRVIRALSKGDLERERFHGDNVALSRQQIHADTVMSATNPFMNLLLNGGLTAMIVVGAFLVRDGLTKPGRIIAFLTYFTIILNAILSINKMFVMISQATASANRVAEVLDLPEEAPRGGLERLRTQAHIVFDNVSFSYNGRRSNISEISFSAEKGSMLGIIGATGSGKTTLIRLLQGFYHVSSGGVYIHGENVDGMEKQRLHDMFGVAFQSDAFFAGTIRDNIDLGRGLSDESIRRAARCAQAEEFILSRPGGYDAEVQAKAVNLSGGQKQRLLIARALAAAPEIVILDDSSSALDYRTDAAMRRAVREEYPDTTLVLIAQRVSSVRNADRIVVMDNGRMAGLGTHEELMSDCPLYAQIEAIQTGSGEVSAS